MLKHIHVHKHRHRVMAALCLNKTSLILPINNTTAGGETLISYISANNIIIIWSLYTRLIHS